MNFNFEGLLGNPAVNMGLGMLAANRGPNAFGNAMQGGLLSAQQAQQMQAVMAMKALQAKELERKQAQQQGYDALGAKLGFAPGMMTPELATKVGARALGLDSENTLSPAGEGVFYDRASGKWITAPSDVYQNRMGLKESEAEAAARGKARGEAAFPKPAGAEDVARLRKEYTTALQPFSTATAAYNDLKGLASQPSAASDVAFLYRYMKMLDPESVVRESEFATAQNAAGVPEQLRNLFNRLHSGERLTPEQRQQFVDSAEVLYRTQEASANRSTTFFTREAERMGIPAERITGNATPGLPPKQAKGPSDAAIGEAARRLNISPEEAKRLLEQP